MKYLLSILAIFLWAMVILSEDTLKIPEGIKYKETTPETNEAAKKLLLNKLTIKATDKEVLELFENKVLICGPGLWQDMKKDKTFSKQGVVAEFQMPVIASDGSISRKNKMEGRFFQTPEEILAFWKAFTKRTDFTDLKIRKLNQEELKIFWAMISFDIVEPLFILESKNHKILIVFTSPENLKIMWIDDYKNLFMKGQEPSNNVDLPKSREMPPQDATLFMSSLKGDVKEMKKAIQSGADINTRQWGLCSAMFMTDATPLYAAVTSKNPEAVKLLLAHGANLALSNFHKETPLALARRLKLEDIVKLIEEENSNKADACN